MCHSLGKIRKVPRIEHIEHSFNGQTVWQQQHWTNISEEHTASIFNCDNSSASDKIPRILWDLKVYYHVHNFPPLLRIMSYINASHLRTTYLPNIHINTLQSFDS
jgi:hypothetical protein